MAEFKGNYTTYDNDKAQALYAKVKDLPIIDYHCHLSPEEIYKDEPFDNIAQMWLGGDHYKWRLMRSAGVDEKFITGDATWEEKFNKFVEVASTAFGNPVYEWAVMELEKFFGIDLPLRVENASEIYSLASKAIKEKKLSPRKLIKMSGVEFIATTDDPVDSLEYHKLLKNTFDVRVTPTFRVDRLVNTFDESYVDYLDLLGKASGVKIDSLDTLTNAIHNRLDYFCDLGCKFSDVGQELFPTTENFLEADEQSAEEGLKNIFNDEFDLEGRSNLMAYLYLVLAKEYKKRNIVMQLHLGVTRNNNTAMLDKLGKDSGYDCIGEIVVQDLAIYFDILNDDDALPETILYTLNPTYYYSLITLSGAFKGVHMGISWWFNDHKRGMFEMLEKLGELAHFTSLVGMLTDSRSFLSYARHDYYRQIVCSYLSGYENDKNADLIETVAKKLCYTNALELIKEV